MRLTDNQQRKVSELEWAWLAGFVDGDGAIGLNNQNRTWQPRVTVTNAHYETIRRIGDLLDVLPVGYYIYERHPDKNPGHLGKKLVWTLIINGHKRVKKFLPCILPFLVTKRKQAEVALDFSNSRLSREKYHGYSPKELELVQRAHELNAKVNGKSADYAQRLNARLKKV